MKNFKFSAVISALAVSSLLVMGTGCQDNQNKMNPAASEGVQLPVSKIETLAYRAIQKGTQQDFDAIDKEYKALNFDELELFNKEIAKLALEKELISTNARVDAQHADALAAASKNTEIYRTAINKMSVDLYGVSYNKLDFENLDQVLSKVVAPAQTPSSTERASAACTTASFPYSTTKMDNAPANHTGWTRRATPSAPNDCDYEFVYSGNRSKISADNYVSQLLCGHWNYRIARRVITFGSRPGDAETRLLFGNNGIALYTGTSLYDVNMQ